MAITSPKVIITVHTKKVTNMLDNYITSFNKNLVMGNKRITQLYAKTYLKHIIQAGIKKWGRSGKSVFEMLEEQQINPLPLRAGGLEAGGRGPMKELGTVAPGYMIVVPGYMVPLDRFNKQPHWVKLLPGRSITKWIEDKGGIEGRFLLNPQRGRSKMTGRFLKKYYRSVKIKRHPWIDSANEEARQYIVGILKGVVNRTASEVKT